MKKEFISIIIPVYNEENNVIPLFDDIRKVCSENFVNFEVIFVNDGSTDATLENLLKLKGLKVVNFRKNFGQTAAIDAGIREAKGELLIVIDGDRQNSPEDIPKLYRELKEKDLDVVSGWRKKRQDPFFKKISSRLAAFVRRFLINDGIHDSGCTLKIYKKECFANIDLVGEMHRFIPAILKIKGFKIGEIEVSHNPRKYGKTKYDWKRGVKGNLDMFSVWFWKKYANRPLHLFGSIGIILVFISIISGSWAVYQKIFLHYDLSETFLSFLSLVGFLIGAQFFVFGLIADMVSKTYFTVTRDKIYDIKEIIEN